MTAALSNPIESLVLRPGVEGDWNFVRSRWIRSYADSAFARAMTPREDWAQGRTTKPYWAGHHNVIERLLDVATLTVASWPEDPWTIVGFACTEGDIVHYVYVMADYWRQGVAKRLLAPFADRVRVRYSHRSRVCGALPIPSHWVYDPYAAFGLEET